MLSSRLIKIRHALVFVQSTTCDIEPRVHICWLQGGTELWKQSSLSWSKVGHGPSLVLIIVYLVAHMISIGFGRSVPRENIGKGSD